MTSLLEEEPQLDFDAVYTVSYYRGVTFYLLGWSTEERYLDDELVCAEATASTTPTAGPRVAPRPSVVTRSAPSWSATTASTSLTPTI